MKKTSLWKDDAEASTYPPLQNDLHVDVAIVGGGITGLTAAHLLAGAGKSVALLEAWRVGGGTTGFSTGNLYATVEERLHSIRSRFGMETAHAVAASRTAAIGHIESLVQRLAIDCDFHRRPWYLVSEIPQNHKILKKEFQACRDAGLDAYLETRAPLPFDISRVLRIENQAQFNPMRYAKALAAEIQQAGGKVFEHSPVLRIAEGTPVSLYTANAKVTADKLIHATHSPKGIRFVHALMGVHREYAIALKLNTGDYPEGIFWIMSQPHQHSIRSYTDSRGENYLLVLGEPHKVGHQRDSESCFHNLEAFAGARFDVKAIGYQWSAQNYRSADGLPYIGALDAKAGVYIATGFATDGLTYGTLAAMIISDLILGNENPWTKLYDPRRHNPLKSAGRFIKENVHVLMDYMHDLPYRADAESASEIAPGEGKTVVIKGEKVAVYRDEAGVLHQISAVCTHMKCLVNWNAEAKSWDCPCHGSRFSVDGQVIEGPAILNLPKSAAGTPH
jgi:glycine/D-amino acid oxidase-like deaminating enzyme/nitrite reductase/ring-hydroxylating ferredoxin subunit